MTIDDKRGEAMDKIRAILEPLQNQGIVKYWISYDKEFENLPPVPSRDGQGMYSPRQKPRATCINVWIRMPHES